MLRTYLCLSQNTFRNGNYNLVPIRDEDKYVIMQWRNEQIELLRQKQVLTKIEQEHYFATIVNNLFEQEKPQQLLFSFLENEILIGYGGLVHIDWESGNGEISFLLTNERNANESTFKADWGVFLDLITELAFEVINFHKIYTYAYNIRDYYFEVMYNKGFIKEGHLKRHIIIKNKLEDVLILSKLKKE